ncbi:uncharacterized protein LOC135834870 [Planococcus citri]|uniref:uncharacterized protein LOC135834870 n=1 Tax=Planococcus citri TaxID=170843 RepID=UPI0031FA075E
MYYRVSSFLALFFAILYVARGDYANYVRRGNKLELVMEPVSSTIEPVSIYKRGPRNHHNYDDTSKYDKNILLTVYNVNEKRVKQDRQISNINDGKQFVKVEPVN